MLNVFDVDYLVLTNISPSVTYLQLWEILKGFTSQLRFKSTFMFCGFLNPYFNISIDMIFHQGPMANTVHNFWAMVQECDVHLIVMLTEVSGASKVDLKTCHLISSSDQVPDCS